MNKNITLFKDDCLKILDYLISQNIKVNAVITDPPFGTTKCKWDSIIPLDQLWNKLNQITYDNSPIIFFGAQPFTSKLIMSNVKNFKYTLVYEKTSPTGFLNAKKMPLRSHEDIIVFYKKLPTYNPQKTTGHLRKQTKANSKIKSIKKMNQEDKVYNNQNLNNIKDYNSTERYPTSILKFSTDKQKLSLHPTQKPLKLMEYLIKTYTNPNDLILDFTCGSGTTLVAAQNLNRKAIGIDNGFCTKKSIINNINIFNKSWIEISKLRLEKKF